MSNGYTYNIESGISLKEFIAQCAHAFGALIEFRDENNDKTIIPNELKKDTYYEEELKSTILELNKFKKLDNKQLEIRCGIKYKEEILRTKDAIKKRTELKLKYEKMLEEVNTWFPPTEDHVNLKNFMIKQLEDSIVYDCNLEYYNLDTIKKLTVKEYKKSELERLEKDMMYCTEKSIEDKERWNKSNKWIEDLRNSLNDLN